MAKILDLNMDNEEEVCNVGKALSSPIRIAMLKLLFSESLNVGELSEKLQIPASSAALHVRILESANLIHTEIQPGNRGSMKLCSRKSDVVNLYLSGGRKNVRELVSVNMPVGFYSDCRVVPTCGLAGLDGIIGNEDRREGFYLPERKDAHLLWSSGGYVEYKFANMLPKYSIPKKAILSMEICSEAPNYREDWKSDITVWLNGMDCGSWLSPGDFGARRGRLNPRDWPSGNTQYGILVNWEIRENGTYINETKAGDFGIEDLKIMQEDYIRVRIGNKEDARYIGGFNIFGESIGDYNQNIILSLEY